MNKEDRITQQAIDDMTFNPSPYTYKTYLDRLMEDLKNDRWHLHETPCCKHQRTVLWRSSRNPWCEECGCSTDPKKWPGGPLYDKKEQERLQTFLVKKEQRKEEERRQRAERKAMEDARLINRVERFISNNLLIHAIFYSFVFCGIVAFIEYMKL
jgi:hypothetical protein